MPARPRTSHADCRRRGFTLTEILIVTAIIAILAGLVLVGVNHAQIASRITRARSDLGLIGTALEAYKADFGSYPRFPDEVTMDTDVAGSTGGYWLEKAPDRGARLLCRTLIAPGPAGTIGANGTVGTANPGEDGADGNGFRIRRTVVTSTNPPSFGGKVYGPYLQPDKWKLSYDTTGTIFPNMQDAKLLDHAGNIILYFPARPGPVTVTGSYTFVNVINPLGSPGTSVPQPLYNQYDNSQYTQDASPNANLALLPLPDMMYILGDRNQNGQIDPGEHAVTTDPYLLWTADPNNTFGDTNTNTTGSGTYGIQPNGIDPSTKLPAVGSTCRAVCNFDVPSDLLKR